MATFVEKAWFVTCVTKIPSKSTDWFLRYGFLKCAFFLQLSLRNEPNTVRKEIRKFRQVPKSAWACLLLFISEENLLPACILKSYLFCAFACLKLHFRLMGAAKKRNQPQNSTVLKRGAEH